MSKNKSKGPSKSKSTFTVDDLISKANDALNKLQPDLACKFYQKALQMEPQNTNIMDALADVLIQLGQSSEALNLLTQSTLIAPNENPYKWMFLAQLQTGIDAMESYNRGIILLTSVTNDPDINNVEGKLEFYNKQISKAYCSIAELYLTDLCYEEGAENKCEEAIIKALAINSTSLDAHQAMASLRFSQNRSLDACNIMEKVYTTVKESIDKFCDVKEVKIVDIEYVVEAPIEMSNDVLGPVGSTVATAILARKLKEYAKSLHGISLTLERRLSDGTDKAMVLHVEVWYKAATLPKIVVWTRWVKDEYCVEFWDDQDKSFAYLYGQCWNLEDIDIVSRWIKNTKSMYPSVLEVLGGELPPAAQSEMRRRHNAMMRV